VVELDGSLHAGRPEEINGAHCKGHNSTSIGVCYVGGADSNGDPKDTRTEEQKKTLAKLLSDILDRYEDAEIYGHCDFSEKACPSFDAKSEYAAL
jgi:N-acetylmuramoyl-L-alanine amidase